MRTESRWQIGVMCVALMMMAPAMAVVDSVCGLSYQQVNGQTIMDLFYGTTDTITQDPVVINCEIAGYWMFGNCAVILEEGGLIKNGGLLGAEDGRLVASTGSIVEIRGGTIEGALEVVDNADVTVYGSGFKLNTMDVSGEISGLDPLVNYHLTGVYENNTHIDMMINLSQGTVLKLGTSVINVVIDIKPDSADNTINLGSMGLIPVGILSSADFDATQVDPWTVELAGSGVSVKVKGKGSKILSSVKDLNGDGRLDLEVKVETENLDTGEFQNGDAVLTGQTYDGLDIQGSDIITIVPAT